MVHPFAHMHTWSQSLLHDQMNLLTTFNVRFTLLASKPPSFMDSCLSAPCALFLLLSTQFFSFLLFIRNCQQVQTDQYECIVSQDTLE